MKHLLYSLLLSLPVLSFGQQNLVPNPGFELYTNCPTGNSQVTGYCNSWIQYTGGTSDYYNSCTSSSNVDVPANLLGYQNAASGNAYAGFFEYVPTAPQREYIATPITAMMKNKVYEVSMSLSLADSCYYASNGIGAFFFDSGPSFILSHYILQRTPQVSYSSYGPITDKINWTRLTGYMRADSAYDNMVIGGFVPDSILQTTTISSGSSGQSYYYIDSVVVRKVNNIRINYHDSLLCAGDTISVNYSVFLKYGSGNLFTAQLSNASGSFSNPVNIGTRSFDSSGTIICIIPSNTANGSAYRIRVIASDATDTSENNGFNIKISNKDSTTISTSQNTPLCAGKTILLTASCNVQNTHFSWSGPNNYNSTTQNPAITNSLPVHSGSYYVTIQFNGCTVTDTLSVTINPTPVKPVATNNTPLCAGDSVFLTSTDSTTGVSYSWKGPNSFSSAAQDTLIANSTTALNGDYIVTANLNGCTRKDTTTVTVKPYPTAVNLSSNSPICAADTLKLFSTTSSTGTTYSWAGPGSFSANTQNTSVNNPSVSSSGWYRLVTDLNGCSHTDSTHATVYPVPAMPNITFNTPLCVGDTLKLSVNTIAGATYSWSGPGSFSANTQNTLRTNLQLHDTGFYKVTATVYGCVSPQAVADVHINPDPFVVIFSNPSDSICAGTPATFTALPNNSGGTPAYNWYVNGQAVTGSGTTFNTNTLNDGDVINCFMTEYTKCYRPYTDQSNDIYMTVLPWLAPAVSISADPNRPLKPYEYVKFSANATDAGNPPKYQWKRNGNDVVGAKGQIWSANTLNDNDSVSVEITSTYKCPSPATAKSNGIIVSVLTSVSGLDNNSNLTLYPNPNNGKFVLKGTIDTEGPVSISIISINGQLVYQNRVHINNHTIHEQIKAGNITAGVYLLKLQTDAGQQLFRFSVK